jgi:hypothetical protein
MEEFNLKFLTYLNSNNPFSVNNLLLIKLGMLHKSIESLDDLCRRSLDKFSVE